MLNLEQKQKLQQKLSPQQIQYIKLLQLNTLDLEQRIKEELEENPLLEEGPTEEEQRETESVEAEVEVEEPEADEDEFDWDELLNSADDLYGYKARVDQGGSDDDHEMPMPATSTLAEDLKDQLSFLDLTDTQQLVADQIIGSLDEDGYLRRPLTSIIDDLLFNQNVELEEEDIERVLVRVQSLDPPGIAARDLRECLLLQLRRMDEDIPGRATALQMLEDDYEEFTMKHFGKLKKALDVDDEALKEAFDLIQHHLDPKPGHGSFSPQQNYITPDFTVRYVDDEFVITLNGRNAPQLHVSRQYRRMLEELRADQKKSEKNGTAETDVDEETREFLKDKFDSAKWFINSINQRRHTMTKVMDAIIQVQKDFFMHGEGHLKPMILKDIAEIIDMDISTVSRVVNGKYVQTEWGVYELKYFFSEGLETQSGEEVSNKEVKALLERIVEGEDKTKPLSDAKLARRLEEHGFKIARRTVTKYREQLNLPVARLRKEIVLQDEE